MSIFRIPNRWRHPLPRCFRGVHTPKNWFMDLKHEFVKDAFLPGGGLPAHHGLPITLTRVDRKKDYRRLKLAAGRAKWRKGFEFHRLGLCVPFKMPHPPRSPACLPGRAPWQRYVFYDVYIGRFWLACSFSPGVCRTGRVCRFFFLSALGRSSRSSWRRSLLSWTCT